MNYLEIYIDSLPIDARMKFGISKNVVLNHIDIEDRLTQKGEVSYNDFYMEFLAVDPESRNPLERVELSFSKLKIDDLDSAQYFFYKKFNKLNNLCTVMYNYDIAKLDKVGAKVSEKLFEDSEFNDIMEYADYIFAFNSKTLDRSEKPKKKELAAMVSDLAKKMNLFYYELLKNKVGKTKSPLFYLMVVVNKNNYLTLPDEDVFVAANKDELKLTSKYLNRKKKAEEADKPDDTDEELDEDLNSLDDDDTSSSDDSDDDFSGSLDSISFDEDDEDDDDDD